MKLSSVTFIRPEDLPTKRMRISPVVDQIVNDLKRANGQALRYKIEDAKKYSGYAIGKALRNIISNAKVYKAKTIEGDFLFVGLVAKSEQPPAKKR